MKMTAVLYPVYLALCVQCSVPESKSTEKEISTQSIKVGVFDGHGGAQTCIWEIIIAIRLGPEMEVRAITTVDIANNVLDSTDAIIIPGGNGESQYLNLGTSNQQHIKDFTARGKGAAGICAGAYLFLNISDYTYIQLNGQQAVDIEHSNRGYGLAKFTLCEEGKKTFPELAGRDMSFVIYYEEPVSINNPTDIIQSSTLAIMKNDAREEGNAPANMTNDKPFFVANNYGKERAFSSIAHPEGTPGMMWTTSRMIHWTSNEPFTPYQSSVVRSDLFNHESLMVADGLKQGEKASQILLNGESEQEAAASGWLEAYHSWDARRWVQGLSYDASPAIRVRAVRYITGIHCLPFLPNLRTAYRAETGKATQEESKTQLEKLITLFPQVKGT